MRENDQKANTTYTYTYVNGNITSKNYYAYTTGELGTVQDTDTWTYGNGEWADLLTKWGDKNITYDAIGNPVVFDDLTMTWQGRQLETLSMGGITFAYDYNTDGQRISKTFTDSESGDTYTTEYFYNGSILAGERTGNNTIVYMYDNNGDLFGFTYNGTEYYYIKNAQNDVTAIADSQGNILVRYYYNAWGSIIDTVDMSSNGIGDINPIRYRSYYYDADTSLYYLNSRYYLAEMCRFLNADEYVQTDQGILDKNMFAYCGNNPVNNIDPYGNCYYTPDGRWAHDAWEFIGDYQMHDAPNSGNSDNILAYSEHQKKGTTNPSNRNKHQNGQSRRQRDNGGEKGDARRTPNPNKRRFSNFELELELELDGLGKVGCCVVLVGATVAAVYIIANDATGAGILDDAALLGLGPIIWDSASKVIA